MAVSLRTLDDGAWVSVEDERRVGASELWYVTGVCDCEVADFVVEGITDVDVDGRTIAAETYGTCIRCGRSVTTDPVPVGRLVDGAFEPLAAEAVRIPWGDSVGWQVSPVSGTSGDD
ncbi:hypothetical protein HUG10_08720 [Halorarum halophilum]|uniref:DUF8134 domain-containing protein n=1 Tax=Halorarum halophilum TaxID=2743090 RepID=A0A7D5GFC5_9EURY|nr:hypothetical protein [Halobaculum halophilum]QLG27630.1 hypothetical protein HUG10_08720 [Halobaculum halophilum]